MVHGSCFTDIGTRKENEDSFRVIEMPGRLTAVVADGLGGQGGGKEAAGIAVETLCRFLEDGGSEEQIHTLFSAANERILKKQRPGKKMMSTAVALYLADDLAVWSYMGDSRLYHFYNGRLVMQTLDHSVSQMAVFRKEITQEQIRFHEDRNRVLRALGGAETTGEETGSIRLEPGFHAFLLCTDGFWEYVLETEMEETLSVSATPEEWLVRMCNVLQQKKSEEHDNFTAAAVFYTG